MEYLGRGMSEYGWTGTVFIVGNGYEVWAGLDNRDRTYDQMVQAARSGKQNIVEGSQISGTSKELEHKLLSSSVWSK